MLVSCVFQIHRFDVIMDRIKGIDDQLKLLFSSGVATALSTSPQNSAVQLALTSRPAITTDPSAIAIIQPVSATKQPTVATKEPAVVNYQPIVATNKPAVSTIQPNQPAAAAKQPTVVINPQAVATNCVELATHNMVSTLIIIICYREISYLLCCLLCVFRKVCADQDDLCNFFGP